MADITVDTVNAILEIQLKNFDSALKAVTQISANFDKSANSMLSSLNRIESALGKLGSSATSASRTQTKASDDTVSALQRQQKIVFGAGEAWANFAAKAASSSKNAQTIVDGLGTSFRTFSEFMTNGIVEGKQFTLMTQGWTSSLNEAQRQLLALVATEKEQTAQQKASASQTNVSQKALANQANSILRAENSYNAMVAAIKTVVKNEEQQTTFINQATQALENYRKALSATALSSSEASRNTIQLNGAFANIKRNAGLGNALQQSLTESGKYATLLVGPLSGVAARLTALNFLIKETSMSTALLGAATVAIGGAFAFSIKGAASFQTGLTKISAAVDLNKKQYDALSSSILDMSKNLMVPTEELNKIALSAAQAGVSGVTNITKFTKVVAELTRTTDLTADSAADSILQLVNVTGLSLDKVGLLGDQITAVGQASVGGEGAVLHLATELAKAGAMYGLTAKDAIAWGGALASTGQHAEAAATAIAQAFGNVTKIVNDGGEKLTQFAKFLNMTEDQVRKTRIPDLLQKVFEQMGKLPDAAAQMNAEAFLGIDSSRAKRVAGAFATSSEQIAKMQEVANTAAGALDKKFTDLGNTLTRQWEGVKVNIQDIGIVIGTSMLGPLTSVLKLIRDLTGYTTAFSIIFQGAALIVADFLAMKGMKALGITAFFTTLRASIVSTTAATIEASGAMTLFQRSMFAAGVTAATLKATLKTILPLLIIQGIVFVVAKLYEYATAEDAIKKSSDDAVGSQMAFNRELIKTGNIAGLLAQQKDVNKQISAATFNVGQDQDRIQKIKSSPQLVAAPFGIPSYRYDSKAMNTAQKSLKKHQQDLADLNAQAATFAPALAEASINAGVTGLDNLSKSSESAVKSIVTLGTKLNNTYNEQEALANGGKDAYNSLKKTNELQLQVSNDFSKVPVSQQSIWFVKVFSELSSAAGTWNSTFKEKVVPSLKSFGELVVDPKANIKDKMTAYKNFIAVFAQAGGAIKSTTTDTLHGISQATSEAARALRTGTTIATSITSKFKASSGALSAAASGDFSQFYQQSLEAQTAQQRARLSNDIGAMSPSGFSSFKQKFGYDEKASRASVIDDLAKQAVASAEASKSMTDLYNAQKSVVSLNTSLAKSLNDIDFSNSLIGLSDYDATILKAGHDTEQQIQSMIDNFKDLIAVNKIKMANSNDPYFTQELADANTGYEKMIDNLQNKIPSAVDATQNAIQNGLDKALAADPMKAEIADLRSSFSQFAQDVIINFNSISDAFSSMLKTMASSILQNSVMTPIENLLTGKPGDASGGMLGGLLKSAGSWLGISSNPIGMGDGLAKAGLQTISSPGLDIGSLLTSMPFLAGGGGLQAGKPAVVGEKGPEIFVPSTSGTVIPNGKAFGGVATTMSNSSSNSLQQVHIVVETTPELDSKILKISGATASNMLVTYDRKKLPSRVHQLRNDPSLR